MSKGRNSLSLVFINSVLRLIERNYRKRLELKEIPLDDAKTYNLLKVGDTEGVFHLDSEGIREFLKLLKPDNFNDLVALFSLYRPASFEAGIVVQFREAKHKKTENPCLEKEIKPFLNPILRETYGVLLYHEQVIEIIQTVAGYSLGEANDLRKLLSLRDTNALKTQKKEFIFHAKLKGFSKPKAEKIFNFLQKFTLYTFSKKHAVSLALTSYYAAYLKAHYPFCFKEVYQFLKNYKNLKS